MNAKLDELAVEAAFSQPENDGSFTGPLGLYFRHLGGLRPVLFFAFPPKAAGTFLRTAAIRAVQGQLVRIVYAQGGRDAQPYVPVMIRYYLGHLGDRPLVAHVHMQALPANRAFVDVFGLKPIAIVRPLKDILASYWDMLETDDAALRDGLNCQFPPGFRDLSRERKADFLVDFLAPWYASYYATWLQYAAADPGRVCVLDYDELQSAPVPALEKVLAHAGLSRPREICEAAVQLTWDARTQFRFNRGESGRGAEYFSRAHGARIGQMLSYYPVLDKIAEQLLR